MRRAPDKTPVGTDRRAVRRASSRNGGAPGGRALPGNGEGGAFGGRGLPENGDGGAPGGRGLPRNGEGGAPGGRALPGNGEGGAPGGRALPGNGEDGAPGGRALPGNGSGGAQFAEDEFAGDEFVSGWNDANAISAQTASAERAGERVGVEEHTHEICSQTSLTAGKPGASAKGMTRWRSCSNLASNSCRRTASRAVWPGFRPLR